MENWKRSKGKKVDFSLLLLNQKMAITTQSIRLKSNHLRSVILSEELLITLRVYE